MAVKENFCEALQYDYKCSITIGRNLNCITLFKQNSVISQLPNTESKQSDIHSVRSKIYFLYLNLIYHKCKYPVITVALKWAVDLHIYIYMHTHTHTHGVCVQNQLVIYFQWTLCLPILFENIDFLYSKFGMEPF